MDIATFPASLPVGVLCYCTGYHFTSLFQPDPLSTVNSNCSQSILAVVDYSPCVWVRGNSVWRASPPCILPLLYPPTVSPAAPQQELEQMRLGIKTGEWPEVCVCVCACVGVVLLFCGAPAPASCPRMWPVTSHSRWWAAQVSVKVKMEITPSRTHTQVRPRHGAT